MINHGPNFKNKPIIPETALYRCYSYTIYDAFDWSSQSFNPELTEKYRGLELSVYPRRLEQVMDFLFIKQKEQHRVPLHLNIIMFEFHLFIKDNLSIVNYLFSSL